MHNLSAYLKYNILAIKSWGTACVIFFTHNSSLPPLLWLIKACIRVQPTLTVQPAELFSSLLCLSRVMVDSHA